MTWRSRSRSQPEPKMNQSVAHCDRRDQRRCVDADPYWLDKGADVACATYTRVQGAPNAADRAAGVSHPRPLDVVFDYTAILTTVPARGSTSRLAIRPMRRSSSPSETPKRAGSHTCPPASSPPTRPGSPSRSWPTTSDAGARRKRLVPGHHRSAAGQAGLHARPARPRRQTSASHRRTGPVATRSSSATDLTPHAVRPSA
jgi:hypothetical protein